MTLVMIFMTNLREKGLVVSPSGCYYCTYCTFFSPIDSGINVLIKCTRVGYVINSECSLMLYHFVQ